MLSIQNSQKLIFIWKTLTETSPLIVQNHKSKRKAMDLTDIINKKETKQTLIEELNR
jgi:hypothetical protein